MNAHDVISGALASADFVLTQFLSDLSDDELLIRPVPQANHIAWQLGHLIRSQHSALQFFSAAPEIPESFLNAYEKTCAVKNDAASFHSKAEYLRHFAALKSASLAALAKLSAEECDEPGPESMRSYAPTKGSVFSMYAIHIMMHLGQFAVVRRKLNKPIIM